MPLSGLLFILLRPIGEGWICRGEHHRGEGQCQAGGGLAWKVKHSLLSLAFDLLESEVDSRAVLDVPSDPPIMTGSWHLVTG